MADLKTVFGSRCLYFCGLAFFLLAAAGAHAGEATADLGESASGLERETWEKADRALKPAEAAAGLKEYLRLFPHGAHAGEALLRRARTQQNLLEARQDFQQAAASPKGPWTSQALLELGRLEYSLGRYPESRQALDECLSLSPSAEARFWRGQALLMAREFRSSSEDFTVFLQAPEPASFKPLARLGKADCLAALGNTGAAESAYRDLQAADCPVAAQAMWQQSALEEKLGRGREAHELRVILAGRYPASFEGQKALAGLKSEPPPPPVKEAASSPRAAETPQEEKLMAWVIQVGSYTRGAWADKLVKLLRKKKYPVTKRVVRLGKQSFHEVRLGPYRSRSEALSVAKKMSRLESLPFVIKPRD
jgi:cell division septation protein DedD